LSVILFDSQFDDKHGVLRNSLGLHDAAKLELHIARLSFIRVAELEEKPLTGAFDIRYLRAIHLHLPGCFCVGRRLPRGHDLSHKVVWLSSAAVHGAFARRHLRSGQI
jgi:hypothetical protein